jgi:hypothetical protein
MWWRSSAACVALLFSSAIEAGVVVAQTPDPALSTVVANPPEGGIWFMCPAGDGQSHPGLTAVVEVTLVDATGTPIFDYPFQDISVDGSVPDELHLCPGGLTADANTDLSGFTTISGPPAGGGGTSEGLAVLLSGIPLGAPAVPILVNSPDLNGDGLVNLTDLAIASLDWRGVTQQQNPIPFRVDFLPDDELNLMDVVLFARHRDHVCP